MTEDIKPNIGYPRWPQFHFDEDTPMWRFMSFDKFLLLLDSSSLWFARTDLFEDPFEGAVPREWLKKHGAQIGMPEDYVRRKFEVPESAMQMNFANCWYSGAAEPAGMWKLFGDGSSAIALRSTARSIITAFHSNTTPQEISDAVLIGKVHYMDLQSEPISIGSKPGTIDGHSSNTWAHFLKRKAFAHESEVRLLVSHMPHGSCPHPNQPKGVPVYFHLPSLIQQVVISPYALQGCEVVIEKILSQFSLEAEVNASQLFSSF